MTCKEKIIIDIEDNTRQYYLDEVTCFEKPFVVLLNDYKNKYGQYFLLLCKILRVYMYGNNDVSDDVKQCLRLFIRDILGLTPIERQEELDIISALIQEMEKGNIVISAGNLYALPYSEIHYHVDNWPHLFIYKDTIMIRRCSESWITYICILRNTKI